MIRFLSRSRPALAARAATALGAGAGLALGTGGPSDHPGRTGPGHARLAHVEMLAPANGDRAGIGGRGWFVDLDVDFRLPLEKTGYDPTRGADGLQPTGPGVHDDAPPFPGTFSMGQDDRFSA